MKFAEIPAKFGKKLLKIRQNFINILKNLEKSLKLCENLKTFANFDIVAVRRRENLVDLENLNKCANSRYRRRRYSRERASKSVRGEGSQRASFCSRARVLEGESPQTD